MKVASRAIIKDDCSWRTKYYSSVIVRILQTAGSITVYHSS